MMDGWYLAPNPRDAVGIHNKMINQVKFFNSVNLNTELIFDKDEFLISKKIRRRIPFFSNQLHNFRYKNMVNLDFIYIRRPYAIDFGIIYNGIRLKKINPNIKILMEYPTYPYDSENKIGKMNFMLIFKNLIWRNYLYKFVDRIVTFSNDEEIHKVKTLLISNGADFDKIKVKNKKFNRDKIEMIAVATISYWHGYDRLINGLNKYYQNNGKRNIILHIVGDGDLETINRYKKLIEKFSLEDHIILEGRKEREELDDIYMKSDIAIDSLGRHRSGVYYNSSLKGKEYLARGLPIISGVATEIDSKTNYPYYFRVPADESEIIITDIIDFYDHNIINNDISKDIEIINSIQRFGKANFDLSVSLNPVFNFIKNSKINEV